MAVKRRRYYGAHGRRTLLRELQAAKRTRKNTSEVLTTTILGGAETAKPTDVDPDDASTAAPSSPRVSPAPSTPTSASSQTPSSELHQATDIAINDSSEEPDTSRKRRERAWILPSVFEGRPPVKLFPYTEACGAQQRYMGRAVREGADIPKSHYVHTNKVGQYNATINSLRQGGLRHADETSQEWSVLWSRHPSSETMQSMTPIQKTNHFPGSSHLGDKGLLWKCIAPMQERFGSEYSITPIGYILPEAKAAFKAACQRESDALWIRKPLSGSCGRGIRVFSSQDCIAEQRKSIQRPAIVQRYVPSPLTINGYKFDMRIYVVVVSYEPLKVYINTEGLVRLATQKYSEDPATLADTTRHLTNYSVNKKSPLFVKNGDSQADNTQSSKWSLTELRAHFEKEGLDYDLMFDGIKDVVIKTLLAVEPQLRSEWAKTLNDEGAGWLAKGPAGADCTSCFELYGFDILLDSHTKPWLLEVNIFPSLSSGSALDKKIKTKLVADMMTLVGVSVPPASEGVTREAKRIRRSPSDVSGKTSHAQTSGHVVSNAELAKKAARLASCKTPLDAVNLFDQAAWQLAMEAHDQDMRRGGLERIYPTCESSKYVHFMAEESYANVVLRKFYEAGGADQFWGVEAKSAKSLPDYVPRKIHFQVS